METMIPPQVGMRPRTKKRKRKEAKKRKKAQIKNERKREKGQCYYPFSTLVLQSSTMIFTIESLLCCHFHIIVGIFHYRTWLVYSNDGLPQISLGLCEQASWMHTHLVFFWAFKTFSIFTQYMSVSHGYSTIGGIEWWLWRRQKGEDSLTSTRRINGLWRCPSIDINVSE